MATISGSSGNDSLVAGLSSDYLDALAGDDTLVGGIGYDTLDGGLGDDIAIYSGAYGDYSITFNADHSLSIRDDNLMNGDSGTDLLRRVNVVEFADGLQMHVSEEQQVNTFSVNHQMTSAVAALADGGYVVTWASYTQDGSGLGVFLQRYDEHGNRVGSETQVNAYTDDHQFVPDIAALQDGGWVVCWASNGQDGSGVGVFLQRYGADGMPLGSESRVNTEAAGVQESPSVTALDDGGFVVAWDAQVGQTGTYGIRLQRYAADFSRVGGETAVGDTAGESHAGADISQLPGGDLLVLWTSILGSANYDIQAMRFPVDGTPPAFATVINLDLDGWQQAPAVTVLADGGFVVVWQSQGSTDDDGYEIIQHRFDANGSRVGGEQVVNTSTDGQQLRPAVSALHDGGWVVSWDSSNGDIGAFFQRYDADGLAVGSQQSASSWTTGTQAFEPSIATLADGSFLIAWTSSVLDGDGYGIFSQRFNPDGSVWGTHLQLAAGNTSFTGNGGGEDVIGSDGHNSIVTLAGDDRVRAGAGKDTLDGGDGGDVLDGEAGNDLLRGNEGNDLLTGGLGADGLWGENGDDTLLGGNGSDRLGGGDGNDSLAGGKHGDTLWGGAGHDTLAGGAGSDLLNGGAGNDAFVFAVAFATGADTITDFAGGTDQLHISRHLTGSLATGALSDARLVLGDAATTSQHRFVFDADTGDLYYDADGSGAAAQTLVATLAGVTSIVASDIVIV